MRRLGVSLLGVSLAFFGSIAPAQAAGGLTIWVNSGEEAAYKAASASWAAKNNVKVEILAKCGLGDCGLSKLGPAGVGPDLFTATHDNTGTLVKSTMTSARSAKPMSMRLLLIAVRFTGAARNPPSLPICQTSTPGI